MWDGKSPKTEYRFLMLRSQGRSSQAELCRRHNRSDDPFSK